MLRKTLDGKRRNQNEHDAQSEKGKTKNKSLRINCKDQKQNGKMEKKHTHKTKGN